ncbi:DCP2-domain-containing protein, partial [Rhodotorula sp. JG-1b]
SSFGTLTLAGVLDDLAARFIVNLPPDELESMDRVCFQIEQAHWYYEDFIRPNASNASALPSYNLKAFSLLMFKSCPLLHDLVPQHARIWTSFMQYKERVPVCGAVLINEWWDKVLLVKGWNKGAAWSFPRGKINKEEPEAMCAVREVRVLEETGFDLTPYFPPAQLHPSYVEPEGSERVPYYVELVIREQKIRLYFIPGIKESTRFETRTRKEISKIDWFRLSDLPTWDRD